MVKILALVKRTKSVAYHNRGAMYEHLRVVPPGKRLRVPSCTRPDILGSG